MSTSVKLKKKSSAVGGKKMPLFFQIICQREVKRIVLDLRLSDEEWADNAAIIDLPLHASNQRIDYLLKARQEVEKKEALLHDIIARLEDSGQLTADRIVSDYRLKTSPPGWLAYMQQVIERKKPIRAASTISNYQSTLSIFSTFLKDKSELPVDGINQELLKEFGEFFMKRKKSSNTLVFYYRILSAVWNLAVADGLIEKQPSPFRGLCTSSGKTRKRAISEKAIHKLEKIKLKDTGLSLARDLFLFCYYARGMNFKDLAYLTADNINGKTLTYVRKKTGQKIEMELLPVMLMLIRKYKQPGRKFLFPVFNNDNPTFVNYSSALRLENKRMKVLGRMIGCPDITTYVARHSWASIAYRRGIAVEIISESMGHTSVKTTLIYIASLDIKILNRANRAIVMGKQRYRSIFRKGR